MDPLLAELKEMGVACGELRPIRSKDGVTVVQVTDSQGKRWVLKHFEEPGFRREIQRYRLLGELGVPTLRLMGATAASLLLEDLEESPALRLGVPEDLEDPAVARLLARWYTRLHQAGREYLHGRGPLQRGRLPDPGGPGPGSRADRLRGAAHLVPPEERPARRALGPEGPLPHPGVQ